MSSKVQRIRWWTKTYLYKTYILEVAKKMKVKQSVYECGRERERKRDRERGREGEERGVEKLVENPIIEVTSDRSVLSGFEMYFNVLGVSWS